MKIKKIEKLIDNEKVKKAFLGAAFGAAMFSLGALTGGVAVGIPLKSNKVASKEEPVVINGMTYTKVSTNDNVEYIPEYEIVTIDGVQYKKIVKSVNPIVITNSDGTVEYKAPANATMVSGNGKGLKCYTTFLEPLTSEEEMLLTKGH